jgi:hypothetical protein
MIDKPSFSTEPRAHIVAGALAHLARHMQTGCARSAYVAALLLDEIARDVGADRTLREHAGELAETLHRAGTMA